MRAPVLASTSAKTLSTVAMSSTSQGSSSLEPTRLRQRLHALAEGLALIGEGEFGARACAARWAMPQAIEWSLATPMIRPRLPFINPIMSC